MEKWWKKESSNVHGPCHQLPPHVTGSGFCDSFPDTGLTPICMNSDSERLHTVVGHVSIVFTGDQCLRLYFIDIRIYITNQGEYKVFYLTFSWNVLDFDWTWYVKKEYFLSCEQNWQYQDPDPGSKYWYFSLKGTVPFTVLITYKVNKYCVLLNNYFSIRLSIKRVKIWLQIFLIS